jgi:isoleucyl-tRNA synthetase
VEDYMAVSTTLGFVLRELIKLMAPFTPFFSEGLYAAMGGGRESVHLEAWPEAGAEKAASGIIRGAVSRKMLDQMRAVRELAAMGLAKRAEAKIKVRQPLASMTVRVKLDKEFQKILADEVNVKKIISSPKAKEDVVLDTAITPELREEGMLREVARMVQELRQKAGLEPKDRVVVMLGAPSTIRDAIMKYEKNLKTDVGAKLVEYKKSEKFDAEEETAIDGNAIWVGIRRI